MKLSFHCLALIAGLALAARAQTAPPPSANLGAAVFEWSQLDAKPTKSGERRNVFDAPTATCNHLECHITTLNPGEVAHPMHRHSDEEIVVVKEGTLEVTIAGKVQRAGPGSVIFYASNVEHGMRNAGTTRATYHVFRIVTAATPKPAAP
jgi:quercetin dioxygenase-like cupin family protein